MNSTSIPQKTVVVDAAVAGRATRRRAESQQSHTNDPWRFISNNLSSITTTSTAPAPSPSDPATLLLLVRHFVTLDLGRAALEIAVRLHDQLQTAGAETHEVADLIRNLERAPSGQRPDSELSARFSANLAALTQNRANKLQFSSTDEAESLAADWRRSHVILSDSRDRVIICTTTSPPSTFTARTRRLTFPPHLTDGPAEARALELPHKNELRTDCPHPYVVAGIDAPEVLRRLWSETADTFNGYSPPIYLLIPSTDSLLAALHTHDLRDIFSDDRVTIFVGSDSALALARHLIADIDSAIPAYLVTLRDAAPPSPDALDPAPATALADLRAARSKSAQARHLEVTAPYPQKTPQWWLHRYSEALAGRAAPLRILIPVSRFTTYTQHAADQILRAFQRQGADARIFSERDSHSPVTPERYLRALADWPPDLILWIDHLRHETARIFPAQIPYICWVQDRLPAIFKPEAGAAIDPLQIIVGLGADYLVETCNYPRARTHPSLVVTDPTIYSSEPLPENTLAPHRCDIAYVSNHSDPPDDLARSLAARLMARESDRRAVELVYRRIREIFNDPSADPTTRLSQRSLLADLLSPPSQIGPAQSCASVLTPPTTLASSHSSVPSPNHPPNPFDPESLRQVHEFYALPIADRIFRHQMLAWTIDYAKRTNRTLRLYGRGWENHPLTKPFAAGVAPNGATLRAVYQAARIHLHASIHGSLHQRVFDGFASGSMVLCRRTRADMGAAVYKLALAASTRLGRRQFTMADAPALADFLSRQFRAGSPLNSRTIINLDEPRWLRWQSPRPPCFFLAFDELIGDDAAAISFNSQHSLSELLDHFLSENSDRARIVSRARQSIIDNLPVDRLARLMLDHVRSALHAASAHV